MSGYKRTNRTFLSFFSSMREHKMFFFKRKAILHLFYMSLLMVMAIFLNPNQNRVIACLIKINEYFMNIRKTEIICLTKKLC